MGDYVLDDMELDGSRFDLLLDEVLAPGGVDKFFDQQLLEVEIGGHIPEDVRTAEDDLQPLHLFRGPVDDGGAARVGKYLQRRVSYDELVERALIEAFEARPDDAELPRLIQKRVLEQRVCRRVVFRCQQSTPDDVSIPSFDAPITLADPILHPGRYYDTSDYATIGARP